MREFLLNCIRELCSVAGVSGDEDAVRQKVIGMIDGYCSYSVDPLGNILGSKGKGGRVYVDAHMDEVGFVVKNVTEEGFLELETVGGIDEKLLPGNRVSVNGKSGVICCKPVHLMKGDERKKPRPSAETAADVGAVSREEAEKIALPGDSVSFARRFEVFGENEDYIMSPALDDRVGCALLIALIRCADADFDFSFTVQEEVGCRGAAVAALSSGAERALALETTTASDVLSDRESECVCSLGKGAVISFMDRSTMYDRGEYETLLKLAGDSGIPAQPKRAVAGGNNMGAIHKAGEGKKAAAISVPARYLHSPAVVVRLSDALSAYKLAEKYLTEERNAEG